MTNTANSTSNVIDSFLAQATPESAAALRDLAETTADKETRKSARRALYLLSQKGIQPAPSPMPSKPALTSVPMTETVHTYASAFDGAGNRLLFFVLPDLDGGSPTLAQILIDDETGVMDAGALRMTRKEVGERLRMYEAQLEQGLALAEIEPDYARHLLRQARALNAHWSRRTPAGFLELASRIGDAQHSYPTAPVYARIETATLRDDESMERDPGALFARTWFDAWFFAAEQAYPWLQAWTQAEALDDVTRRETQAAIVTEAVSLLMNPDMRLRYARRLEESADILLRRDQEEVARQAVYHALTLREEALPTENPFARLLAQRTIEAALDLVREQQTQQNTP